MNIINYVSSIAIPMVILLVVIYGVKQKNKVYDSFVEGAKEGIDIVINIFPTLVGLFIAIGLLRSSGIIELISKILQPILTAMKIPIEIMPLALLRPISGSASMAIATDIMKTYGVDSLIGIISSTIMGSTETTLYTIAIYTSAVGIKKIRYVLIAALTADIVGMVVSTIICNIMI